MDAVDHDDEPVAPVWLVVWGLCVAALVPDRLLVALVPERPVREYGSHPAEIVAARDDCWRMIWLAGIRYGGLGVAMLWLPLQLWVERLRCRPDWSGVGTRARAPIRDEVRGGGAARLGLALLAAAWLVGVPACAEPRPAPGPALAPAGEVETRPVVLVWFESGMNWELPFATLEFAAWEDGRILWADTASGERRLLEGTTDPRRVVELLDRARAAGVFQDAAFQRAWFPPDAGHFEMRIREGGQSASLMTSHEQFELDPALVMDDRGVRTLAPGESRADALAASSDGYQRFRAVWADLRAAAAALIPAEGRPSTLADDHRAWREWRKP